VIARPVMWLAVATVVGAASGCARDREASVPEEKQLEFGRHRVRVSVPTGWEMLDQGRQKRFRKGEFEIVLQSLGPATPSPHDLDGLVEWGLTALGHDQRSEIKSRHVSTLDGREAVDIETWNRLDHSNPGRIFLVSDDGDVLALQTVRMAFEDSLAAFDTIRGSLHFASDRR